MLRVSIRSEEQLYSIEFTQHCFCPSKQEPPSVLTSRTTFSEFSSNCQALFRVQAIVSFLTVDNTATGEMVFIVPHTLLTPGTTIREFGLSLLLLVSAVRWWWLDPEFLIDVVCRLVRVTRPWPFRTISDHRSPWLVLTPPLRLSTTGSFQQGYVARQLQFSGLRYNLASAWQ